MARMSGHKAPRYQGKITTWKDAQGFGFITPNGGGPAVFVHIKSFADRGIRPAIDDIVTYHLAANEKGQPRAESVAFARHPASRDTAPRSGKGPLIATGGFLVLLAAFVLIGKLPALILGLYLGVSTIAFIAYWLDKSAARNNQRRTPEKTLHMLALAGGWPGALLAQKVLKHKSKKESFQAAFKFTVAVNCGVLVWLLSPSGSGALRTLLGMS
jgi:uncharacterized membrane protein YsdA (DUF1294 family)/cold shock CspA family protein